MANAVLGMRGNGDWSDSDMRPKSWREGILYLYPNGDAPLTAMTSKLSTSKTEDPEYYWWTQGLPSQAGAVTNVYTDILSTAYVSGGTAGDTVYVKMAEALADEFRSGHQVILRDVSDYTMTVVCKVTGVVKNGANSYIACKLLEDDDNGVGDLSDCDYVSIIGNINPEGGAMPDAIAYDPTKYYNYTQIFRTPLSITRTARKTRLRTEDQYKKAKGEALEMHSIEMEKAFLWGIATEGVGDNGKPERTTQGVISFISANGGIVSNYITEDDALWNGQTWLNGGEDWLDTQLEQIFRYGSSDRLAYVGSGALLHINRLAKDTGQWNFTPSTAEYGISVMSWTTPFGTIHMKRHPLFSYEAVNRTSMLIFDPKDVNSRVIDDTTFYADPDKKNTGAGRIDCTDEEFLTEIGCEWHHPQKCAWLNGFGSDNTN